MVSLSLSGGGYRAMLFHVGTLRRLNDAGMLPRLAVVSSVSGGSIASAYLAYRWPDLTFDSEDRATNFAEVFEKPLAELASTTMDIPSVLVGLLPFTSAAAQQTAKLNERLFNGARLADITSGNARSGTGARPRPLFVLNATSLQTGEHWQFRATAMGGPVTGWTAPGDLLLAQAVAASSGFPPLLSPVIVKPAGGSNPANWYTCVDYRDNPYGVAYANEPGRVILPSQLAAFREAIHLTDGGVRDNLGIAPVEEMNRLRRLNGLSRATVALVSDGGATTSLDADPSAIWVGQTQRVLGLLSDQPDEVRVGNLIRAGSVRLRDYQWTAGPSRPGCANLHPPAALNDARRRVLLDADKHDAYVYWSIRRLPKMHTGFTCPDDSPLWMVDEVRALSQVPTALRAMPSSLQARLVNWGYLAAHHGLPYVDFAWPDPQLRQRWLGPCSIPHAPAVTDPEERTPSARDAKCATLAQEGTSP
jgi:NTE family protein